MDSADCQHLQYAGSGSVKRQFTQGLRSQNTSVTWATCGHHGDSYLAGREPQEMSGRLEEMPGDRSAIQPILGSWIGWSITRGQAGSKHSVRLSRGRLYNRYQGRNWSPGGDISEPVTQNHPRIVRVFRG